MTEQPPDATPADADPAQPARPGGLAWTVRAVAIAGVAVSVWAALTGWGAVVHGYPLYAVLLAVTLVVFSRRWLAYVAQAPIANGVAPRGPCCPHRHLHRMDCAHGVVASIYRTGARARSDEPLTQRSPSQRRQRKSS